MIQSISAHIIDREKDQIIYKENNSDLNQYVEDLHEIIEGSKNTSIYTTSNPTIGVIASIIESVQRCDNGLKEENTSIINRNFNAIALRFLGKETDAQEQVEHLVRIKIGCLVQAILKTGDGYQYFISKANSSIFLNNSNLKKNQGIEISDKPHGKSCIVDLHKNSEGAFVVVNIRILLDNKASYFHKEFLEVEPQYKDDYNTRTMVTHVLNCIDSSLKKEYPRHRLALKNAFLYHVQSNDFIDYGTICADVFLPYINSETCDIDASTKETLKRNLQELPTTKKFSTQFNKVAKEVKAKIIQSAYDLNPGVQLVLSEFDQAKLLRIISSGAEVSGREYVKIYTNDQEALKTFAPEGN